MKRTWKQICSLLLSVSIAMTMLPTTVLAATSGEITGFEKLDTEVAQQTVLTGTVKDNLNLPTELTAIVATGSAITFNVPTSVGWQSTPTYDGNTVGDYIFKPTPVMPVGVTLLAGVELPTITVRVVAPPVKGTLRIGGFIEGEYVPDLTKDAVGTKLGWIWDAATGTLTLTKNIGGNGVITFDAQGDVIVKVSDSDNVSAKILSHTGGGMLTIEGGGTLSLNNDYEGTPTAILAEDGLTISNVTVDITTTTAGYGEAVVIYKGDFIMNSGTLNITATGDYSRGIVCQEGDILIFGGTVKVSAVLETMFAQSISVSGGTVEAKSSNDYAIRAYNGIDISNGSVTAESGFLYSSAISSDVIVTGGTLVTGTVGMWNGSIDGDITVSGKEADIIVNGDVNGSLVVSAGTVTVVNIVSGSKNLTGGTVTVNGMQMFPVIEALRIIDLEKLDTVAAGYGWKYYNDDDEAGKIFITDPDQTYTLTGKGPNDVYVIVHETATGSTLILENMSLTSYCEALDIYATGITLRVSDKAELNGMGTGLCFDNTGSIVLDDGSELTINATVGYNVNYGAIYAPMGLTINGDGTVIANGKIESDTSNSLAGIKADQKLTVLGGAKVSAVGGIRSYNGITIDIGAGSQVTALTGGQYDSAVHSYRTLTIAGSGSLIATASGQDGYGLLANDWSEDWSEGDEVVFYKKDIYITGCDVTASNSSYPANIYSGYLKHTGGTLNGKTADGGSKASYSVTVTNGTAQPLVAAAGTAVTLTAGSAPAGQRFKEWSVTPAVTFVEGTNKSQTAKFTMPAQTVTAEAVYEDIPAGVTPVTGVILYTYNLFLYHNASPNTANLTVEIEPLDATDKSVTWKSDNTAVATVDENGKVTAVGNGKTTITVTTGDSGYTNNCTVTVSTVSTYSTGGGSETTPDTTPGTTTPTQTPTSIPTPTPTATLTENLSGGGGNLTLNIYENEEDNSLSITINLPVDDILAASGETDSESPLALEIPIGSEGLLEYIRKSDAPQVKITLTIPAGLSSDENVNISNIGLTKELLEAAREEGKDITVSVTDENGKELYAWTFEGSNLAGSENDLTDVNLALTLHTIGEAELEELLNENLGEETGGMIIRFGHEGMLPSQASIRIYVGDQAGVKPGDRIYLYHYNPETGKLETLPYSSGYKVDKDGYITVDIVHCSDYAVLPKEATANQITSLRNQIKVTADRTKLTAGDNKNNTAKITVQLPTTLELVKNIKDETSNPALGGVTVTFSSSNTKVVTVDEDGLITAKGKGTASIRATVTLYSKKTKTLIFRFTVK